jgi:hypothetical protein
MRTTAAAARASTVAPGQRNACASPVTTMTDARLNPASSEDPTVPTESMACP